MISVAITTYNHKNYIAQAIESVLVQKCDEPIELIIGDDCSTDGTSDICVTYANNHPNTILYFRNESNVGILENYRKTFQKCSGEYIAWLDGDDYWCDEHKLQKQVYFLKSEPYLVVVSDRYILKENMFFNTSYWSIDTLFSLLHRGNSICTPTVILCKSVIDEYLDIVINVAKNRGWKTIDFGLWANLSHNYPGTIYFMNDITAVYRILQGSGSHGDSKSKSYLWDACVSDMYNYYYKVLYGKINISIIERIFHLRKRMLLNYGWIAREQIWPLLKLFPYYPIIFYRSIVRKLKKK